MMTTRAVAVSIFASPERVYEYAVSPANLLHGVEQDAKVVLGDLEKLKAVIQALC